MMIDLAMPVPQPTYSLIQLRKQGHAFVVVNIFVNLSGNIYKL